MRIEINPRSLFNLENICEVLYKLHPSVLDDLINMERTLGSILGVIDLDNPTLEQREFLVNIFQENIEEDKTEIDNQEDKIEIDNQEDQLNLYLFDNLRKYIQLNTDEYIPMKIYVEVEDPVVGKKVRELVRALDSTSAPEEFYLNKRELDEDAFFAEGYGLTMNKEQLKQRDDFLDGKDVEGLKDILRKEKLFP